MGVFLFIISSLSFNLLAISFSDIKILLLFFSIELFFLLAAVSAIAERVELGAPRAEWLAREVVCARAFFTLEALAPALASLPSDATTSLPWATVSATLTTADDIAEVVLSTATAPFTSADAPAIADPLTSAA